MYLWQIICFLYLALFASANLGDIANCELSLHEHNCPPDLGFASKTTFDFRGADWNDAFWSFWSVDETIVNNASHLCLGDNPRGAGLSIWSADQVIALTSRKYMMFGKVSVEMQAAKGQGLLSTITLESDSGNEIRLAFPGDSDSEARIDYVFDGRVSPGKYNATHGVGFPTTSATTVHTIEWTENHIAYMVNSELPYTAYKTFYIGDIPPADYPETPMRIKLGLRYAEEDTTEDQHRSDLNWDEGPFTSYIRTVEIEDYTGYCKLVNGPVEYHFDENLKGWEDVKISGCDQQLGEGMYTPVAPSMIQTSTGAATEQATSTTESLVTTTSLGGTMSSATISLTWEPITATHSQDAPEETGSDEEDGAMTNTWSSLLVKMLLLITIFGIDWVYIM